MTECINVYRATQSIARSLLSCGVRLFVTLMYRNGQTYYQTFLSPGGPIILVFQNCEIPTGSPSTGAPNRCGVPKICDFQPFQKYRYRIPRYFKIPIPNTDWHEKIPMKIPIPTPNTDTDPALQHRPTNTRSKSMESLLVRWATNVNECILDLVSKRFSVYDT